MNGPALAVAGAEVALVWYTQGGGASRVQTAWSHDSGKSFGAAQRVDTGGALGRVDASVGPGGRVLMSWLRQEAGTGTWTARSLEGGKTLSSEFAIAAAGSGRGSGILRRAAEAEGWFAALTEDDGRGLLCARIRVSQP